MRAIPRLEAELAGRTPTDAERGPFAPAVIAHEPPAAQPKPRRFGRDLFMTWWENRNPAMLLEISRYSAPLRWLVFGYSYVAFYASYVPVRAFGYVTAQQVRLLRWLASFDQ